MKPISETMAKVIYWRMFGYAKDFPRGHQWYYAASSQVLPEGYDMMFAEANRTGEGMKVIAGRLKATP